MQQTRTTIIACAIVGTLAVTAIIGVGARSHAEHELREIATSRPQMVNPITGVTEGDAVTAADRRAADAMQAYTACLSLGTDDCEQERVTSNEAARHAGEVIDAQNKALADVTPG